MHDDHFMSYREQNIPITRDEVTALFTSISSESVGINEPYIFHPSEHQRTPLFIFDLDDTIWHHVRHFIRAVGEATGKPVSLEYYRKFGNSREVPEWKNDSKAMAIHDKIVQCKHPRYLPFVGQAHDGAVEVIDALADRKFPFVYLTSRPEELYQVTQDTLRWNKLPVNNNQHAPGDPSSDLFLQSGSVFYGKGIPMNGIPYKKNVVDSWEARMQKEGWRGQIVVVDDLLGSFRECLQAEKIIGIALEGDVNAARAKLPGEKRVPSWETIGHMFDSISDASKNSRWFHIGLSYGDTSTPQACGKTTGL